MVRVRQGLRGRRRTARDDHSKSQLPQGTRRAQRSARTASSVPFGSSAVLCFLGARGYRPLKEQFCELSPSCNDAPKPQCRHHSTTLRARACDLINEIVTTLDKFMTIRSQHVTPPFTTDPNHTGTKIPILVGRFPP